MKVFTTFIFAAKKYVGCSTVIFNLKNKLGRSANLFFMGKIKVGHPTYFSAAEIKVVKTFMASNLLFVLENKSWGIKPNSKEMPIRCGPGNPK